MPGYKNKLPLPTRLDIGNLCNVLYATILYTCIYEIASATEHTGVAFVHLFCYRSYKMKAAEVKKKTPSDSEIKET